MAESDSSSPPPSHAGVSRRNFIKRVGATGLVAAMPTWTERLAAQTNKDAPVSPMPPANKVRVNLKINGESKTVEVEPRVVLLDALRENLNLPGTKKGCDHGQCGACTVLLNGKRMYSCLSLAVMHDGDEITTVEGLEKNGELHPMQAAFIEHDAFQCGGCTSGQIMSAVGLLKEPVGHDVASIKDAMSGNICRCGAYKGILAAVQSVRGDSKA